MCSIPKRSEFLRFRHNALPALTKRTIKGAKFQWHYLKQPSHPRGGKPEALYVGRDGNVYVFNGGLSGIHSQTGWLDISRVNGYGSGWKNKLLVNYTGLHSDWDTNAVVRDDGFVMVKCQPRPLIAEWFTQTFVDKNAVATVSASDTFNILRVIREPEDFVRTK